MSGALVWDWGWMDVDHVLLSHAEPPVFFSSCYFTSLHLHTLKVHRSLAIHPMVSGSLYRCKPHQPGTYHFQQVSLIS